MIQKVKINDIRSNDTNPRTIQESKFKILKQSLKEFPEMLRLRPIVVDENNIILGGNMRYKACQELKLKEVYIVKADDLTQEQKDEFIIKDNTSFGQWDWDILANDWQASKLNDWGLGVWENTKDDEEYKPIMFPSFSNDVVTKDDIEKAKNNLGENFSKGTGRKFVQTMCPECAHEFNIEVE